MFESTRKLYAELAKALGTAEVPADADGNVQLTVGETATVALFAESELSLMLVAPVAELPKALTYGTALWLLRRNFYDSPIAPFRVSCDVAGSIVVWGRVPAEGMTGEELAKIIEALAAEADFIREEVGADAGDGTQTTDAAA